MNSQGETHHSEFLYRVTGSLALSLKILVDSLTYGGFFPTISPHCKLQQGGARLLLWSQLASNQWEGLGMQHPLRWLAAVCLVQPHPVCPLARTSYISISFLMMLCCLPALRALALLPKRELYVCSAQ